MEIDDKNQHLRLVKKAQMLSNIRNPHARGLSAFIAVILLLTTVSASVVAIGCIAAILSSA